jgi:four helix bundle protein
VGVKHHEDLVAWQLADQLASEIHALTSTARATHDRDFCEQIRGSSRSAASNIAEGFWRYHHREFARFLTIARASLGETQNHLRHGRRCGYLDANLFDHLWELSSRALGATTRLLAYLLKSKAPSSF